MRNRNQLIKYIAGFFLSLIVICTTSCSTEVDLFDDYREIAAVYGLLELDKDTNWIKITKAFQGQGNALDVAQIADSSNYQGKLDVQLLGRKNGNDLDPVILDTLTISNKLAGDSIFYFPQQLMYFTTEALDPAAVYTLRIVTPSQEVFAESPVVNPFSISEPRSRIDLQQGRNFDIKWKSAENGKLYEVNMIWNYRELMEGTSDTIDRTLFIGLSDEVSLTTEGGKELDASFSNDVFWGAVNTGIQPMEGITRFAGEMDIIISCGGLDLYTYILVNRPTNSVVQEIPQYSNIEEGVGIFSSRITVMKTIPLSSQTITELTQSGLGFVLPTE